MNIKNGTIINQYKIISAIGKGGMGEVFLAQDTKLDRKVALKILPPEFAEDKDRMSRFVREAKSASALSHPNIITIHEIGADGDTHFIATEYIEGETLHTRLQGQPLSQTTVLEIALQITSALDAAHRAGIVHRDIKPENVMIRPDGLVKLLDFGIAKLSAPSAVADGLNVDGEAPTAIKPAGTSPGMVIGTASYMSPEQARGQAVDARSDIFSFGLVLYEMLTGRRAFAGENALDVIGAILHKEPQPLNQIRPGLPREIERIVNKTLRKERDERYQTARGLLTDLQDAKQELEFQDKLERTAAPQREEAKTQLLAAPTTDEPQPPTSSAEVITQEIKKHKRGVAAVSIMLLALLGLGYWFFFQRAAGNKQIESIAVLPFENRSGNADSEYLSDGLAESLIYRLSQLPDLKVSPTSSVFRYKGKETDPQVVARELGVDSVMTGRITQRGESLTISVNLVDTRNGKSLWGEQYERKMSELLTTQREIAAEITNKLQLKLSGESEQKLAKKYTDNNEAYQLYLQGRYHLNKRQIPELEKAVVFFKQTIEKDPNYALAYSGLADTYSVIPSRGDFRPKEYMPQAKQAALKALELDPNLAEAHTSLAQFVFYYEYDFAGAEKSYKRAIELNPNYAGAHQWYSLLLAQSGRHAEANREITKAIELDPFSFPINGVSFFQLIFAGRFDEALLQVKKRNELFPNELEFHMFNSRVYAEQGKYDQAVEEYELAAKATKDFKPENIAKLKEAYEKGGWDGYGRMRQEIRLEELNAKQAKDPNEYVKALDFASAYAWSKDKDKTIEYLNKAYDDRERNLTELKINKIWDFVRDDPRFKELVKKVGIPE